MLMAFFAPMSGARRVCNVKIAASTAIKPSVSSGMNDARLLPVANSCAATDSSSDGGELEATSACVLRG